MPSIAARTRPRSVVPLTTTRAVLPAAMTLTVPFAGSSRSASKTWFFASASRLGGTSVAAMLAEVSITTTTSPASPAGRSRKGRAARSARSSTSRSWSRSSRLRRRRCHGAFASTSVSSRCQRRVDGTTRSSRRSLSRYIASTTRHEQQPEQRERRQEAHRQAVIEVGSRCRPISPAPADVGARRRRGRRAGGPSRSGHRSRRAGRPGRRSPPARRRGAPCSRRSSPGRS